MRKKVKNRDESCRVWHSGFRGYRDNSPKAKHDRLDKQSIELTKMKILEIFS